ncbi:MAG: hypothetical protein OJF49_002579 [Ktedonobacterales bacterium]|jgi:predicted ATPase/DNA-binding CsgD family transcriptional regulator/DNA-binding SARP family transcriptional activator|nr:MAG: hypothetical protein OJF49_002579 [Ktedonobacterales bacterium]
MAVATLPQDDKTLRIYLLGGLRVCVGSRVIEGATWRQRNAKTLLKALALARHYRLSRDTASAWLWPEEGDHAVSDRENSLNGVKGDLRRVLEPGHRRGTPWMYLRVEHEGILVLGSSAYPCWTDVAAFAKACDRAHLHPSRDAYRAARDLYTGDLLPEDAHDGTMAVLTRYDRTTLHDKYLHLLEQQAAFLEKHGERDEAIASLHEAIARDATRQTARRDLMRLYALDGKPDQARGQYHQLVEALRRVNQYDVMELPAGPELSSAELATETRRLYEDIVGGKVLPKPRPIRTSHPVAPTPKPTSAHPTASAAPRTSIRRRKAVATAAAPEAEAATAHDDSPRWRGLDRRLAERRTPFIGRVHERAAACQALTAARMLTLWGAGGSGKTQLAIQVADDLRASYPDGIHIVELATVSEPSQIPQAVAVALGIHEEQGRALTTSLATWLGRQRLLLILDNGEHLIDACVQLGSELLGACPRIGILITSRGPASDEPGANLRLPSSEPLFGTPPRNGSEGLRAQRGCALGGAALRLPSLALPTLDPLPTLSHLRENESVRLFCEHAALSQPGFALTQENARSVAEICARLDGIPLAIELAATRVKLLDVARIAARLDDCFALLPTRSGRLPRRKTLHETIGWSHELLKGQARVLFRRLAIFAGGWDIEAAEAICAGYGIQRSHVLRLLELLVNAALVEVETQNAERRYRFLEPIRQYADEKLREAREADRLRQRHATWFQALAQRARPHLTSAQQQTWLLRLKAEYGNLLAALRWTYTHCSAEVGLWLASAMWRLWYNRGQLSEGYTWLEAMLAREPGASLDYRRARIAALYAAGHLAMVRGDLDVAQTAGEECLALAERLGDSLSMSDAYSLLGGVAEYRDQLPQSLKLLELSLALARQLGNRPEDKRRIALSLSNLADVLAKQHDLARAEALYAEGLALFHGIEDLRGIAMSQTNLGRTSHRLGHAALAIQNLEESAARFRALEDLRGMGDALATRALVAYAQRDYIGALARYDEAAEIYARAQCRILVVESLEGVAHVIAAMGQPAQAAHIFGAADGQRSAMAAPRHQMDDDWYAPLVATLRKRLGAANFIGMHASGRALPLDEAVAAAHALVAQVASANERATQRRAKGRSELLSQPLTPREREVLHLLRQGLSKIEIATRFDRSERTIDTHMGHIYAKLGVSSREAAIAAWEGRRELVREMSRAEIRPGIRER